jgi:hypothetical protein
MSITRHPRLFLTFFIFGGAAFGYIWAISDAKTQYPIAGVGVGLLFGSLALVLYGKAELPIPLEVKTVTLDLPLIGQVEFEVPNNKQRIAGWRIFVEFTSRIASQELQTGVPREAMSSLYELFKLTREQLKGMEPSPPTKNVTVEVYAFYMLNLALRPFLSKWHPRLLEWELTLPTNQPRPVWSEEEEWRKELKLTQRHIVYYLRGLGELLEIEKLDRIVSKPSPDATRKATELAQLNSDLTTAGLLPPVE